MDKGENRSEYLSNSTESSDWEDSNEQINKLKEGYEVKFNAMNVEMMSKNEEIAELKSQLAKLYQDQEAVALRCDISKYEDIEQHRLVEENEAIRRQLLMIAEENSALRDEIENNRLNLATKSKAYMCNDEIINDFATTNSETKSTIPNMRPIPAEVVPRSVFVENDNKQSNDKSNNDKQNYIIDSETGKRVYNNWTKENERTVKDWKTTISKTSFICEDVKEKCSKVLQNLLIIAMVAGAINTMLSGISATVIGTDPSNPTLARISFVFLIVITFMQGTVTAITGAIKILKLDEKVNDLSTYIQKLDNFYAILSSELKLSHKLRRDAIDFIIKQDEQFLQIMQQSPNISPSEYQNANNKFMEFIKNGSIFSISSVNPTDNTNSTNNRKTSGVNFKCSQKYNYKSEMPDVV